jgi:outer membrane protein TolC
MNMNARKLLLLGILTVNSFLSAQDEATDSENNLGIVHTSGDEAHGCERILTVGEFLDRILECNFDITTAKETYLRSRASLRGANGTYDTTLGASANYTDSDGSHSGSWSANLAKSFESGGSLTLQTTTSLSKSPGDVSNETDLVAQISQPLLKDLIWNSDHVGQYTACIDAKSAYLTALNSIGSTIETATNLYWNNAQVNDQIRVRRWAEAEYQGLIDNLKNYPLTKKVLEDTEKQLLGRQSTLIAARLRDEKTLDQNFLSIQLAMGYVDYKEAEGLCTEKLPNLDINYSEEELLALRKELQDWTVNCNYEVLSADLSQESSGYSLKLAQNQVLPTLTWTTNLTAKSSKEGTPARAMLRSYSFNSPTYAADAALAFSVPLCNNVALASLESASSSYRDSHVNRVSSQYNNISSVVDAINNFEIDMKNIQVIEEGVKSKGELYTSAKEDLDTRADLKAFSWVARYLDNLVDAEIALITSYRNILTDILSVRQVTSTLFSDDKDLKKLVVADLRTFPEVKRGACEEAAKDAKADGAVKTPATKA